MSESLTLFERGNYEQCLQKIISTFAQLDQTFDEYLLLSKLTANRPLIQQAVLKKALQELESKYFKQKRISSTYDLEAQLICMELSLEYARLCLEQSKFDEAKDILNNFKAKFNHCKIEWGEWLIQQIEKMIDDHLEKRQQPKYAQREEQAAEYNRMMQEMEQIEYFKNEGFFGYLIPAKWLATWKSYVNYREEEDQQAQKRQDYLAEVTEKTIDDLRAVLGIDASSIEEEENVSQPGPLDGSQFFQLQWDLLLDPFPPKKYQNYSLKSDLTEGQDFVFVTPKIYTYFHEIYGGIEAKRMIIAHQHTKKPYIELKSQTIQFIVIPFMNEMGQKYTKYSINMGSKEHFQFALQKALRGLQNKLKLDEKRLPEARWIKFDSEADQIEYLELLYQKNSRVNDLPLRGKVITQLRLPFEEMNITENDILIFEVKIRDWQTRLVDQSQHSYSSMTSTSIQSSNSNIQKLMSDYGISPVPRFTSDSRMGLTGLQNLGNTCFMNSSLQCLSNVYELTEFMVSNQFVNDLNVRNPIGTKGFLATSYADLLKQMWYGKQSSVSAWELKRVIGKFAPQFYGYGQQDSQELLSYVLDGLHEDMNRVLNKPTVEDIDIDKESDQEAATKLWNNYLRRNNSKIIDLVAGQFKSTLDCPKCNRKSRTYDPFLSISLPIPSYQLMNQQFFLVFKDTNETPLKVVMNFTSDQTAKDIVRQISSTFKIEEHNIILVISKDHKIKEYVKPSADIKYISDQDGILFAHQIERKSENFKNDETFAIITYIKKIKGMFQSEEKHLSYQRMVCLDRRGTTQDLYLEVYKMFRPHLVIMNKQEPNDFYRTQPEVCSDIKILRVEIEEYIRRNQLPFTIKIGDRLGKNKMKELQYSVENQFYFQESTPLANISQELRIDVVMADSVQTDTLKLQRCKQYSGNENNEPQKKKSEYSIQDCLQAFSKVEILGKGDEWYCNKCKSHVNAQKKMEVYKAPQILILHLKRFRTNRIHNLGSYYFTGGSQKISTFVSFPLKGLDLNNYILSKREGDTTDYTYDLFGVSNHFGGMGGGHYTAYGFSPIQKAWYDFNDSSVRSASTSDIVSEAAYLLFYRRRDSKPTQLK